MSGRTALMSEYLGWREQRAPAEFRPKFDRDILPSGPITAGYEEYVKNVFSGKTKASEVGALGGQLRGANNNADLDHGVSATRMLDVERQFGRGALDTTNDEDLLRTPLESLYAELGLKSPEPKRWNSYPVYAPKQSAEYHSTYQAHCPEFDAASNSYRPSFREAADAEWSKSNRQTLIDYKDFSSPRLSPYLYQDHPYVRAQDSRIVGSNFVQVTSRPKDRFLEKVDDTLAMVRAMPRY